MIWDLYQQRELHSVQRTANLAGHKADEAAAELARMKRQIEHLTLSCQAMWELLRRTTGLTDAALQAQMLEVDLRDGVADGKIAPKTLDCAKCGSKTHSRRKHCIMCGEPVAREHLFE